MYKSIVLMSLVASVFLLGCEKLKDTSSKSFIQNCTKYCQSNGLQFDELTSLNSNPDECICVADSRAAA